MKKSDAQEFFDLWDSAAQVYGKTVSDPAKEIIFKTLARYSLQDVARALELHIADPDHGQFIPKPADVIAKIDIARPNGWLGADEAWALFPHDESASGCVCDEMLEAFGTTVGLDQIAGRMAFRDAYNRLVAKAKAEQRDPVWRMSLGHDQRGREEKTLEAVEQGKISANHAIGLLPHLPEDEIKLLESKKTSPQKLLAQSEQKLIGLDQVTAIAEQRASDDESRKHLAEINKMLGIKKPDTAA